MYIERRRGLKIDLWDTPILSDCNDWIYQVRPMRSDQTGRRKKHVGNMVSQLSNKEKNIWNVRLKGWNQNILFFMVFEIVPVLFVFHYKSDRHITEVLEKRRKINS